MAAGELRVADESEHHLARSAQSPVTRADRIHRPACPQKGMLNTRLPFAIR